jgi:hypothetical protein
MTKLLGQYIHFWSRGPTPSRRGTYVLAATLAAMGIAGCAGYTKLGTTPAPPQQPAAKLSVTPSVSFGSVSIGSSATQDLSIKNAGTMAVNISQASISGAGFSMAEKNSSFSIPAAQSATVQIQFAPQLAGAVTGKLSLASDASKSPLTITLSGAGAQPGLTISPSSITFGNVPLGQKGAQSLKLTNTGTTSLVANLGSVSGTSFSVSGLATSLTIGAGHSATLTAEFSPTSAGAASGNFSITSSGANSTLTVPLSGTGTSASTSTGATPGQTFSVAANGAIPDSKEGFGCAIAAGSTRLVCQDVTFAPSDTHNTIAIYGAISNVNTSSTTGVSPGSVTVTPASMANIVVGTVLYCQDADNSHGEQLVVTEATRSTFTATFTISKSGTWSISSNYVALYTSISSVIAPSTVVLAAPATQTVTSAMVQIVGHTDNYRPIQNTVSAACAKATPTNPSTVSFPAGTYGHAGSIAIPNGCSHLNLVATGRVVLLDTTILSNNPTKPGFGQGATVLALGYYTARGRGTNLLTNKTSISSGSNILKCGSGCSFTVADIGQPLYLQYAGPSGLPLWTTITGVSGSPGGGVYPAVILANNAQTSLPLTPQGIAGPAVVFGYQVMQDIDIGGINFQNIGFWFHPGFTTIGIPLVALGADAQVVKQGLKFHDSTLVSATNGCIANNGPNDQFLIENITCLGMTDVAFYMSGFHSNGTVKNTIVDNTQYPFPKTALTEAFLLKGNSNTSIESPVVRCHCLVHLFNVGDYANFNNTISGADLNGEGSTPGGIVSNIATGLAILNAKIVGINGNALRFDSPFAGGIKNVTITGANVFNITGGGIWLNDDSGTGHGASNITFQNNEMQVSGNAINAQNVEGTNHWSGNQLINVPSSSSAAWQIIQGKSGSKNFVSSNGGSGFQGHNYCDVSCVVGP